MASTTASAAFSISTIEGTPKRSIVRRSIERIWSEVRIFIAWRRLSALSREPREFTSRVVGYVPVQVFHRVEIVFARQYRDSVHPCSNARHCSAEDRRGSPVDRLE